MTELMRQDPEDKERVERTEGRQSKFQEELRAAKRDEESSGEEPQQREPEMNSPEQNKEVVHSKER